MHYFLSESIGFFIVPSNVIASFAGLGLLLLLLRRRCAAMVSGLALAVLVTASLSPLGNMLFTPLEQRFPYFAYPDQPIDGIIILGGSYDTVSHSYVSEIVLQEDTEPVSVVPDLARRYPTARIIVSGGSDVSIPGPSEAAMVKQTFISWGIPANRILTEEQSQTTAENARFTARLLQPRPQSRWLLVTSPYHMPRAVGAFRKAGFNVMAFPAGPRTHGWREFWWPSNTATDNLRRIDLAIHEWFGLVDYRLRGFSDAWFPGP
ncbi:MAG: YdcF family protein [Acetobacteraceae bacterium]